MSVTGKKISALDAGSLPLTGTEIVPILQDGVNKKVTARDISNLGPSDILGAIAFDASAPTPGKSGKYSFTTGGSCTWLTGGAATVAVGDEVVVVFTAPSTYTYTKVGRPDIEQVRSQSTSKVPSSKLVDDELNNVYSNLESASGLITYGDNGLSGVSVGDKWLNQNGGVLAYNQGNARFEITTGAYAYSGIKLEGLIQDEIYYVELKFKIISQVTPGLNIWVGSGISLGDYMFALNEYDTTLKTFRGYVKGSESFPFYVYQKEIEAGNVYQIADICIFKKNQFEEYKYNDVDVRLDSLESTELILDERTNEIITTGNDRLNGNTVGSSFASFNGGQLIYNSGNARFEITTGASSYSGIKFNGVVSGQKYYVRLKFKIIYQATANKTLFVGNNVIEDNTTFKLKNLNDDNLQTYEGIIVPNNTYFMIFQTQNESGNVYQIMDFMLIKINEHYKKEIKVSNNEISNRLNLYNSFTWATAGLNAKLAIYKSMLFICEYSNSKISIYDIRNNLNPVLLSQFATGTNPRDCKIINGFLFVVCHGSSELKVYNLSNITSPSLMLTHSTGVAPKSMILDDNYILIPCNGTSKVEKHEITQLNNSGVVITKTDDVLVGNSPLDISFNGSDMYGVCGLGDTVKFIKKDTFDVLKSLTFTGSTFSTGRFINDEIFVASDSANGILYFIDASTDTPYVRSQIELVPSLEEITIIGYKIYLPELTSSVLSRLFMIDISDIMNPFLSQTISLSITGAGFTAYRNGFLYVSGHFSPYNIDIISVDTGNAINKDSYELDVDNYICIQ